MAGTSPDRETIEKPASPRRWFNFRWRFLLLLPLALLVVLGVYGPRQHRQKQAIAALKERGAILRTEPTGLPFVAELAGEEYSQIITEVYWLDPEIADDDLALLNGLTTLRKVELTGSSVKGEGLKHLAGMQELYILHLGKTRITDDVLAVIPTLPNLGILSLSETGIGDDGVKHLADAKQLEHLFLDGTALTDTGLASLGGLTQLKELSLNGLPITDEGLVHLKPLKNLELLKVENTKITETGLTDLLKHMPKCYVPVPEPEPAIEEPSEPKDQDDLKSESPSSE